MEANITTKTQGPIRFFSQATFTDVESVISGHIDSPTISPTPGNSEKIAGHAKK